MSWLTSAVPYIALVGVVVVFLSTRRKMQGRYEATIAQSRAEAAAEATAALQATQTVTTQIAVGFTSIGYTDPTVPNGVLNDHHHDHHAAIDYDHNDSRAAIDARPSRLDRGGDWPPPDCAADRDGVVADPALIKALVERGRLEAVARKADENVS